VLTVPDRPGTTVRQRAEFQRLQALEDAIAYRAARLAAPCPACGCLPGDQRCDEHARDLELIGEYRAAATAANAALARSIAACQGNRVGGQRAASTGKA
jgi:hypothetical protein